ncbi:MAG: transporter substrate-binding domain-containing protein [Bilophila wadsworthia]
MSITDKRKKAICLPIPTMNCIRPWSCRSARKSRISKSLPESGSVARSARAMVQTIPASKIKMIVKTYDEVGLAFEDLAKGNLDAVMCDDPVAKYYANTKDEYRDKFHIGLVTGDPEFYGFALRKNDKELAQKLNAGIKAVQEKGIEKQILEKWFGTN